MNSDKLLEQWRSLIQEVLGQLAKEAVQTADAASERAQSISTIIDRAAQAAHQGFLSAANHVEIGTVRVESDIKPQQGSYTDLIYRVDGHDFRVVLNQLDAFGRRGPVSLEAGKYTAVFLLYKQGGK